MNERERVYNQLSNFYLKAEAGAATDNLPGEAAYYSLLRMELSEMISEESIRGFVGNSNRIRIEF